jgi:hypothetical protein
LAAKPVGNWPKNEVLDLKAISEATGLPLDYSTERDAQEESWIFMPWYSTAPRSSLGILEGMWSEHYELVLEADRVRVIPVDAAVGFWRAWWAREVERK